MLWFRKCKTIERKLPSLVCGTRDVREVIICVKYADRILSCNRICYDITFLLWRYTLQKAGGRKNTTAHKLNDVGRGFLWGEGAVGVKCRSHKSFSVVFFHATLFDTLQERISISHMYDVV